LACAACWSSALLAGAERRFFDDDPLTREPETQDASKVNEWEIDLIIDLATNLVGRPGDSTPNVRARNINTIDEVPDSNWFTNRLLTRPVTPDEISRGPLTGSGPARDHGRWCAKGPDSRRGSRCALERAASGSSPSTRRATRRRHRRHHGGEQDLLGARAGRWRTIWQPSPQTRSSSPESRPSPPSGTRAPME
jgi:hypothetical protein